MNFNTLAHRETIASARLRLFALYVDFPASVRARWATSTIGQMAGKSWTVSSELWKIDSLKAGAAVREMVTTEAAKADIILVVVSSLNYRQTDMIQWLEIGRAHV